MTRRMDGANQIIESRERKLLGTIFIVLVAFLVSWGPYCLLLVIDSLKIAELSTNEYCKKLFNFFTYAKRLVVNGVTEEETFFCNLLKIFTESI